MTTYIGPVLKALADWTGMNEHSKQNIAVFSLARYTKVIVKKHKYSKVLVVKPGCALETSGKILKNTHLVNQNVMLL